MPRLSRSVVRAPYSFVCSFIRGQRQTPLKNRKKDSTLAPSKIVPPREEVSRRGANAKLAKKIEPGQQLVSLKQYIQSVLRPKIVRRQQEGRSLDPRTARQNKKKEKQKNQISKPREPHSPSPYTHTHLPWLEGMGGGEVRGEQSAWLGLA